MAELTDVQIDAALERGRPERVHNRFEIDGVIGVSPR